ncbi:DUF4402 domain-containing protein [Marinomonas balearica]|uniref:DUF4402 domain-containing protein n=1 Tax=Marinomonas balearica TaxID=491947 RepID=UPI001AAD30AE|nr:DUF4402 domain-containing protein [Marinomonas balearica]
MSTYAEVTESSSLDFGTIVVASNSSVQRLSLSYNGNVSYSSGIYPITEPTRAEFILTGYPNDQRVFLSSSVSTPNSSSTGYTVEQFTLTDLSVPAVITTDSSGSASFYVGGTLTTSGNSGYYGDTAYSITYRVSINY